MMNAQAFLSECRQPFVHGAHDCAEAVAAALRDCAPRLCAALAAAKQRDDYATADVWSLAYTLARECRARCVETTEPTPAWGLADTRAGLTVAVRSPRGLWYAKGERGPRRIPTKCVVIAWEPV